MKALMCESYNNFTEMCNGFIEGCMHFCSGQISEYGFVFRFKYFYH
jgi:hypothetical protein